MKLKSILLLLLVSPGLAWATTAYLRLTSDGSYAAGVYGCDTAATRDIGTMGGYYYDAYGSKSGVGPTGSSAAVPVAYSDQGAQTWDQDIFGYSGASYGNWQAQPTGTLTSATLNISISKTTAGSGTPTYCAAYTTNSGSIWTTMGSVVNSQATLTVSGITSISGLGLMIGCQTSTSSNSVCTVTAYDVWLVWTYTPASPNYLFPVVESGWLELPDLFDERFREHCAL